MKFLLALFVVGKVAGQSLAPSFSITGKCMNNSLTSPCGPMKVVTLLQTWNIAQEEPVDVSWMPDALSSAFRRHMDIPLNVRSASAHYPSVPSKKDA
jgi:hypothetical protein